MKLTKTLAATVTGLALSVAVAAPASAVDTTTTITLTAGSLTIAAPATAAGTASVAPGSTMTVNMGETTVTDARGSLAGWSVTGSSTNFVKTDTAYSMPNTLFTWATGPVATTTGGILAGVSAGAGGSMGAAFVVAVASPAAGGGTFTYTPTVAGVVPVNMVTGAYVGTITQSVL